MKTVRYFVLAIIATFSLASCDEDELQLNDSEQQLIDNFIEAEEVSSRLYNLADLLLRDENIQAGDTTIYQQALAFVNDNGDIIVDFAQGVYGDDGILREGIILIQTSGDYLAKSGTLTIDLENFTEGGRELDGNIVIGSFADSVGMAVQSLKIDTTTSFNSSKGIRWVSGFGTLNDETDDRYQLSGSSDLSSMQGSISAQVDPQEYLTYDRSCEFGMVSGIFTIILQSDSTDIGGSIDFRLNDGCDNIAEVSVEKDGTSVTSVRQFNGF